MIGTRKHRLEGDNDSEYQKKRKKLNDRERDRKRRVKEEHESLKQKVKDQAETIEKLRLIITRFIKPDLTTSIPSDDIFKKFFFEFDQTQANFKELPIKNNESEELINELTNENIKLQDANEKFSAEVAILRQAFILAENTNIQTKKECDQAKQERDQAQQGEQLWINLVSMMLEMTPDPEKDNKKENEKSKNISASNYPMTSQNGIFSGRANPHNEIHGYFKTPMPKTPAPG